MWPYRGGDGRLILKLMQIFFDPVRNVQTLGNVRNQSLAVCLLGDEIKGWISYNERP